MSDHVDKIQVAPQHLARIQSQPKLGRKFLEVTNQKGKPVMPHVLAEMIAEGLTPESCPACGERVEGMFWSIGRFPPIAIYGARCPNAEPEGPDG